MAEFSKLFLTDDGRTLIAKSLAGTTDIDFKRIASSSSTYAISDLPHLTELEDIRQSSLISKKGISNGVAVKLESSFSNMELTIGYYVRAIGLYAADPDKGEILYGVTVETSGNCYMPACNGITVSGMYIKLITTMDNADNIALEVDPAAVATIGDIIELRERVTALENRTEQEPKELPFSWAEIKAKCEAGDFTGINVGDYKVINLSVASGRTMVVEVAGIDLYTNETAEHITSSAQDAYPEHHIDFITRDCIMGESTMHDKPDNTNWTGATIRPFLNATIFGWLDSDLQSVISEKIYEYNDTVLVGGKHNPNATTIMRDKIWLPTEVEVFGFPTYSRGGCGVYGHCQYPIFNKRKAIFKSEADGLVGTNGWWLCSADAYSTDCYCLVSKNGTPSARLASLNSGVAFGFRIQKDWA